MTGAPEDAGRVGYGRPPKHTQFKPGRSGNPRGRPRGAKTKRPLPEQSLQDVILAEAARTIPLREGDRTVDMPMAQAVMRSIAVNAAKGQTRAQALFAKLVSDSEQAKDALRREWLETAITYKANWERELERRARKGETGPDPLPHPDHVRVDLRAGEVKVKGPMTKEEQAELEEWKARLASWEEERAFLQEWRDDPDADARTRAQFDEDIARTDELIRLMKKTIAYDFDDIPRDIEAWRRKRRARSRKQRR